jgi:hypothetical protein
MNDINSISNLKSDKFSFLWLLLLGSIFVVIDSYNLGADLVKQADTTLRKFGAQSLTFEAAVLGLSRELIPVKVCIMLASLSPLIGAFEYIKVKKNNSSEYDKWRFLIKSRIKSVCIVAPFLVLLGLAVSLLSAYIETTSHALSSTGYGDFAMLMVKGIVFGISIALWGIIQIRLMFKWSRILPMILIYIVVTTASSAMILFLDFGITSIMT